MSRHIKDSAARPRPRDLDEEDLLGYAAHLERARRIRKTVDLLRCAAKDGSDEGFAQRVEILSQAWGEEGAAGTPSEKEFRQIEFFADALELLIAQALAEMGSPVAPFHALRLCARWEVPSPGWTFPKLAEACNELWNGAPLPTPQAVREYEQDLHRLRAAADVLLRKRAPDSRLSALRKEWAQRLRRERPDLFGDLSPRTLERWQAGILDPVLSHLPGLLPSWRNYVARVAAHLGFPDVDSAL